MRQLYFARHGESEANVLAVISNRGRVHGLTATGRSQAEMLAEKLRGNSFSHVYSSPLLRAIQTAEIVSRRLRLSFEVTDALREYDCGLLEGCSDADSWQQHRQLKDDWLVRKQWDKRIEQGESFLDMRARFVPFVEQLVERSNNEPDANVLLIGHGGLYICMLPLVLRNVSHAFALAQPFPNTGTVRAELESGKLWCREWCGGPVATP